MDPLLDLMRVLRPKAALFGAGLDASGHWGLAFRPRHDLLFCWIEYGACLLLRPGCEPLALQQGDFVLIYTSTPFTLASDGAATPLDSEAAVSASQRVRLQLGSGTARPVRLHAGKFLLEKANQNLLAGLFPPVIHLAATDQSLGRVRALLTLNEQEASQPGPASEFVIVRLVELVLLEILRTRPLAQGRGTSGLLAGLADPVAAKALAALHAEVAHNWTVAALARHCGVSRASFAARFRKVVGLAPIEYLLQWRIALAKDALASGKTSVGEIAFMVGFQSASAFTTAFTRAVGCSPTRFARQLTPPAPVAAP